MIDLSRNRLHEGPKLTGGVALVFAESDHLHLVLGQVVLNEALVRYLLRCFGLDPGIVPSDACHKNQLQQVVIVWPSIRIFKPILETLHALLFSWLLLCLWCFILLILLCLLVLLLLGAWLIFLVVLYCTLGPLQDFLKACWDLPFIWLLVFFAITSQDGGEFLQQGHLARNHLLSRERLCYCYHRAARLVLDQVQFGLVDHSLPTRESPGLLRQEHMSWLKLQKHHIKII